MGHLYQFGFYHQQDDIFSAMIKNIITGGTALFVFISGFMFHRVFYENFIYKDFMLNKFKNIFLPYFFLSSIAIILAYNANAGYFNQETARYAVGNIFSPNDSNIETIIKYYLTGRVRFTYWYIPFAILLFAMASFHVRYLKLRLVSQITIILALSVLSMFVHRPVASTNPLQYLVYLTPVYLAGMLASRYSKQIVCKLEGHLILLFLCVLALSAAEYLTGHQGNYSKPFFAYNGVDIMYVQKIFLCFFCYVFLEKYTFNIGVVNTIAATSFAIFFIHPWIMPIVRRCFISLFDWVPHYSISLYLLAAVAVISTSMLFALMLKKILRGSQYSRYLIGY
jgi:hypothetical protein